MTRAEEVAAAWPYPEERDPEFSVLGALLIDESAPARVAPMLSVHDFASRRHAQIFEAILALAADGNPTDPTSVGAELRRRGQHAETGGLPYLAQLLDGAVTAANVEYHARLVREAADRRRLEAFGATLAASSSSGTPLPELFELARAQLTDMARDCFDGRPGRLLSSQEIENRPLPPELVQGILTRQAFGALVGPPGVGKSFVALDLAYCIATGRPWLDHDVQRGPVVYVAAEGSGGLGARVRAWKRYHAYAGNPPVFFLPVPAPLTEPAEVASLVRDLRGLEEPPVLTVVDTLARCFIGDENSAEHMGRFIAGVDRLRDETGGAVLAVHHMNASAERERGSTALRGAVDVLAALKEEDGILTLSCEKSKDLPPFPKSRAKLVQVGDSCAVEAVTDAMQRLQTELRQSHREALEALQLGEAAGGFSASKWLAVSGLKERTFYAALKVVTEAGYVSSDREGRGALYRLTPEGAAWITANCKITA